MIKLELLLPRSSPPVDQASGASSTALQVQPAAGSGAERAPSDPFARTSRPTQDFEAVRAGLRSIVNTFVIDLGPSRSIAAGTALVLPLQGTAFMIDKGSDVGPVTLHIQDQSNNPVNTINVFPGDTFLMPFTFILLENTSQSKVLRIHYGTDIKFFPGLGGNITFTGGLSITQTALGSPQGSDQASVNGKSFQGFTNSPNVAGQNSSCSLEVPNGSALKVYVDFLRVSSTVATQIFISAQALQFNAGAGGSTFTKDGTTSAVLGMFTGNNKITGTKYDEIQLEANKNLDVYLGGTPIVIPSNAQLAVTSLALALVLSVTFFGRAY